MHHQGLFFCVYTNCSNEDFEALKPHIFLQTSHRFIANIFRAPNHTEVSTKTQRLMNADVFSQEASLLQRINENKWYFCLIFRLLNLSQGSVRIWVSNRKCWTPDSIKGPFSGVSAFLKALSNPDFVSVESRPRSSVLAFHSTRMLNIHLWGKLKD